MNNTTKLLLSLTIISGNVFAMHHANTKLLPQSLQGHTAAPVIPANETMVKPPVKVDEKNIHLENETHAPFVKHQEENIKIITERPGDVITRNPEDITLNTYQFQTAESTHHQPTQQVVYGTPSQTVVKDGATASTIIPAGTAAVVVQKPGMVEQLATAGKSAAVYTKDKTALFGGFVSGWLCMHPIWSKVLDYDFFHSPVISANPAGSFAFLNKFTRLKAVETVTAAGIIYGLYKLVKNVYEQRQEEDVFANN